MGCLQNNIESAPNDLSGPHNKASDFIDDKADGVLDSDTTLFGGQSCGEKCASCPASTNHHGSNTSNINHMHVSDFGQSCEVQCVRCPVSSERHGSNNAGNVNRMHVSDFIDDKAVEVDGGVPEGDRDGFQASLSVEETNQGSQVDLDAQDAVDCFCHNCMRTQVCFHLGLSMVDCFVTHCIPCLLYRFWAMKRLIFR